MPDTTVTATLLISCGISEVLLPRSHDVLFRNDGNIIHADEHTDQEESVFLQRGSGRSRGSR